MKKLNYPDADIFNPSTGMLYKNPSHLEEALRASNQTELLKMLSDRGRQKLTETFKFDEGRQLFLPGFKRFLELEFEEVQGLMNSLMRSRPNIFKVHIRLGDYPTGKRVENRNIRALHLVAPQPPSEIGKLLANAIFDKNDRVVELLFSCSSIDSGNFHADCTAVGTTKEEFEDKELFKPIVEISYFQNF
jgi:hypothetical protein